MKAELIKIGNSQGIRIPKPLIEQCGLEKSVTIEVRNDSLVISAMRKPREGWDNAFQRMHDNEDDKLIDGDMIINQFDQTEWVW